MRHLTGQPFPRAGCLERRREEAERIKAAVAQRGDKRFNRSEIGRDEVRTIEDHEDKWRAAFEVGRGWAGDAVFGRPGAHLRQGLGARHRPGIEPGRQGQLRERCLRRHRAAGLAEMAKSAERGPRHRGDRVEARIGSTVARQDGQRDAARAR